VAFEKSQILSSAQEAPTKYLPVSPSSSLVIALSEKASSRKVKVLLSP